MIAFEFSPAPSYVCIKIFNPTVEKLPWVPEVSRGPLRDLPAEDRVTSGKASGAQGIEKQSFLISCIKLCNFSLIMLAQNGYATNQSVDYMIKISQKEIEVRNYLL